MPTKDAPGYTYKALINGEWQDVTIAESPLELVERFEQDEEWTRVRHGHWISTGFMEVKCSICGAIQHELEDTNYCPNCGAKMDEVEEDGGVD